MFVGLPGSRTGHIGRLRWVLSLCKSGAGEDAAGSASPRDTPGVVLRVPHQCLAVHVGCGCVVCAVAYVLHARACVWCEAASSGAVRSLVLMHSAVLLVFGYVQGWRLLAGCSTRVQVCVP